VKEKVDNLGFRLGEKANITGDIAKEILQKCK